MLGVDGGVEDEEHKKNRIKGMGAPRKWGIRSLEYVQKWIEEGRIILLNPFEYRDLYLDGSPDHKNG